MNKIKTYNKISVLGLNRFDRETYEVGGDIAHPDALMLRSQKLHDEPISEGVRAIARCGAGVNNIPVDACTEKGIVVFNTPGANANAVKELVLTGMLLSCRDISGGMAFVQSMADLPESEDLGKLCESEKKNYAGIELDGKTLGVVGLGAIGSMVADAALALGMNVVGYDPALSVEAAWRLSNQVERMENLPALLARCHFLSLHVPAIEATKGLINADAIEAIKPGAVICNFAREAIVDTAALIQGIESGKVRRYVADFPARELLGRSEVILMPHLGASTAEAEENCAVMAANQLMDFLEDGNIVNSVNFPATQMDRGGQSRLTFSNRNVSGVLGEVLSVLADHKVNVGDMVNKSRNDIAYNIIDVDGELSEEVLTQVAAVSNVISVRGI